MSVDWNRVDRSHVEQACENVDKGNFVPPQKRVQTFLVMEGRRYPAKSIRGLAYKIATGKSLEPDDFGGGEETSRFFSRLGFVTARDGVIEKKDKADAIAKPRSPRLGSTPKAQKAALGSLLKKRFREVNLEAKFPWLVVPAAEGMDDVVAGIFGALRDSRGHAGFATSGRSLCCDYYIPSHRLIIEYDEFQHFTDQRAIALRLYPSSLSTNFDRERWIAKCESVRAIDRDPPYRDEQRAFYDALRDLGAIANGVTLVRIQHGDFDWTLADAEKHLDAILPRFTAENLNASSESATSERPNRLVGQASDYAITPPAVDSRPMDCDRIVRKVALVTHNYNVRDSVNLWDFSAHFDQINQICDKHGCDTILYALFTLDGGSMVSRKRGSMFDKLQNVDRIILEVGDLVAKNDLATEVWMREQRQPTVVRQKFTTSGEVASKGAKLIAELADRRVGAILPLICGESNIVGTIRKSAKIYDPFHINEKLEELGIELILNPIHDYMRRFEMRLKRKYLSIAGRTVISVWNQGRKGETKIPWTVFHNGGEQTDAVRELPQQFPKRPDIRIGILDLPALASR